MDPQVNEEIDRDDVVRLIQLAVDGDDCRRLATLLASVPGLVDQDPVEEQAPLYLRLMKTLSQAKRRSLEDDDAALSMDDVGEVVRRARELATEAEEVCLVVTALNNLREPAAFVQTLTSPYLNLPDLTRSQFQVPFVSGMFASRSIISSSGFPVL